MQLILPAFHVRVRARLCETCPTPCAHRPTQNLADPALICPLPTPRWLPNLRQARRVLGLGDAVATVAQPLARLVGKATCSACQRRKQTLNHAVPDLLAPVRRLLGHA